MIEDYILIRRARCSSKERMKCTELINKIVELSKKHAGKDCWHWKTIWNMKRTGCFEWAYS
jgi:hypothetical protein